MVGLKRELGLFQVTAAGVGVIIGAGIYALLGIASGHAGNAVWISFLISSLVALFTGLSYAELSSMFKGDAAEYDYVKTATNRKFAFFVAMTMIMGTIISSAAVALGFAGYFIRLFPMSLVLVAVLHIVLMTLLNVMGIKDTSRFNIIATFFEFVGLFIIIIIGLKYGLRTDYIASPEGVKGIFSAAALVFFAFLGFEGIVKLRDETKDPEKTIPKAIILSIIISAVLYALVALSAVRVLGWERLSSSSAPLAEVASAIFGSNAFIVLAVIALFSTSNTVLLTLVAASRQIYGIAKEHSLPKILSKVSPKTGTPVAAILVTSILAIILSLIGNIEFVADLTNLFLFIAFAAVNLSLLILRYKCKDMHRGFVCPGNIGKFSVVALLGLLTSLGMTVFVVLNLL